MCDGRWLSAVMQHGVNGSWRKYAGPEFTMIEIFDDENSMFFFFFFAFC